MIQRLTCFCREDKRQLPPTSPPPAFPSATPPKRQVSGLESVFKTEEEWRGARRALFNFLLDQTRGYRGFYMQSLSVEACKSALFRGMIPRDIVDDLWHKFGLPLPMPTDYDIIYVQMKSTFDRMDAACEAEAGSDHSGAQLSFEEFSRFIAKNRIVDADFPARLKQMNEGRSVVGNTVVARDVPESARVLIVQLKEVRGLSALERGGEGTDPFVTLSLRCPRGGETDKSYGRQQKQSSVHGNIIESLIFDPPEYFGFVILNHVDLSKAQLCVLLSDKKGGMLERLKGAQNAEIGSAVYTLRSLDSVVNEETHSRWASISETNNKNGLDRATSLPQRSSNHPIGDTEERVEMQLCDCNSGEALSAVAVLGLQIVGKEAGFAFSVDYAYEYERWRPSRNPPWGSDSSC